MNIKDLEPGSFQVVEQPKQLNIKDLAPDSYQPVESEEEKFQRRLAAEDAKTKQLKEDTAPGMLQSAVTGASTLGDFLGGRYAAAGAGGVYDYMTGKYPELKQSVSQNLRDIDQTRDIAYEANPGSYITGSIAGGLASGGAGAKAAQALGGGVKGAIGAGVAEGAAEAVGSSRAENLEELADDVKMGAGIGGLIPGVTGTLGKAAKATPNLLPGAREGNTIGNRAAASLSPRRLMPGVTKEDLLDYYANPELRKKASSTDVSNEISKLSGQLGDEMSQSRKAVGETYEQLEEEAVAELAGDVGGVFDGITQTIANNPPKMYRASVKDAISVAKDLAEGKAGATAGLSTGERFLEARRYLDDGVGDRKTLSKRENKLIDEARQELQSVLRTSEPMRQADDLYSEFSKVRGGLERQTFSGPASDKQLDPDKLRRAMTTTTLKGDAFQDALGTYNDFIQSNPKLASMPEVQKAKASLDQLKEVIDVGQLEYKLSKSGGPTAEAVFIALQAMGSTMLGPAAFLGMPLVNPTVWASLVDVVGPKAKTLMENIEKAAPAIRSAAIRETVRAKRED